MTSYVHFRHISTRIITCVILFKIAYIESVLSFFKKDVLREVKYNENSMCQISTFL